MHLLLVITILIFSSADVTAIDYSSYILKALQYYGDLVLKAVTNETKCSSQIKTILNGITNFEEWPLIFLDATAKIQPSLLNGNTHLIGGFDQCLGIDIVNDNKHIQGQYCTTKITVSKTVNTCIRQKFNELEITGLGKTTLDELESLEAVHYDICVPSGCSVTSLQNIWNAIEKKLNFKFTVLFNEALCTTVEKQNSFATLDIVVIIVFSTIALIVISSTIYDVCYFQKRKHKNKLNIYMAFSFYTNGKRLISVKSKKSNISCLNGIRVISIAWIIVGHRTLSNFTGEAINAVYAFKWFKHQENMFIMGAFSCVDTFFLISGFLIVYAQMTIIEKGLKINVFVFYLHRILRLTPALAAILLFHLGIFNHLGSGPLWPMVDVVITNSCRENWWTILLYVQNYVVPLSGCITQTWYIAADTQLYFISPLLVIPLQKWSKSIIAVIIALIIVSNAITAYTIYYYQLDGIFYSAIIKYWQYLYLPTHLRVTPWLMGLILGYYMFQWKDKDIFIRKRYVILFWIIALLLLLVVMYGYMIIANYKFSLFEAALFLVLSRIFWSIGICWIIFACQKGYGGFINKFLSLPIFVILARLSYSMFLTHTLVLIVMLFRERTVSFIDNLTQFHSFWGDYAFCVLISIVWTLTFESPITILEKSLFGDAKETTNEFDETKMETRRTSLAKPSFD